MLAQASSGHFGCSTGFVPFLRCYKCCCFHQRFLTELRGGRRNATVNTLCFINLNVTLKCNLFLSYLFFSGSVLSEVNEKQSPCFPSQVCFSENKVRAAPAFSCWISIMQREDQETLKYPL